MGRPLRAIEEDLDVPHSVSGRSARLELLEAIAALDVPYVRRVIAGRPVVFLNEPELIAQVLVARARSFEDIRDDLMILFITGAENPRNALPWALQLLSHHPEAAQRMRDEAAAACVADGELTPETLQRLPFTVQVFKEALRLYPPGYAFGRRAIEDLHLGPLQLSKDAEVVVSPYALHRRPTLFERPDDFDPARFDRRREAERHPCAYLPFGAAPRGSIGGGFALLQGQVVLAGSLGGGPRFTPAAPRLVQPEP